MQIKEMPLVSVLIPCFNHEKYIKDCLHSIIAQSYKNIEIIISDDCSNDNSYNVILSFQTILNEVFPRVVIKRNEFNVGVVRNLNKMIKICHGKYIKEIASDDILLPDGIMNLVAYAEEHSKYDVIYSNAIYIDDKDHFPIEYIEKRKKYYTNTPPSGNQLTAKLCEGCFIAAPTALIRMETFLRYGEYNDKLIFEDWEFWLRVSETGEIGYCDKISVAYRVLEGSMSHFSDTEIGRKKYKRFTADEERLLNRYDNYCTKEIWSKFYNGRIGGAFRIHDEKYGALLISKSKDKGVKLTFKTRIKILLSKLGIINIVYALLKK